MSNVDKRPPRAGEGGAATVRTVRIPATVGTVRIPATVGTVRIPNGRGRWDSTLQPPRAPPWRRAPPQDVLALPPALGAGAAEDSARRAAAAVLASSVDAQAAPQPLYTLLPLEPFSQLNRFTPFCPWSHSRSHSRSAPGAIRATQPLCSPRPPRRAPLPTPASWLKCQAAAPAAGAVHFRIVWSTFASRGPLSRRPRPVTPRSPPLRAGCACGSALRSLGLCGKAPPPY